MHIPISSRTVCIALFATVSAAPSRGGVDFGNNWGLILELEAEAAYDTNLTARRDSIEDGFVAVEPQVTLARRGSATLFEIDASAKHTWFGEYSEFDSTDPQANLRYAFPAAPGDEARSRLDLHWDRISATNVDLGRRLRSENLRGQLEQRLFESGRTGVGLVVTGRSSDYMEPELNTNESWVAGLRAGYALTARSRVGLVYTHEWMRSIAPVATGDTNGDEDRVVLRANGELLPTLRGSIEGGVAFVSYEGAVTREDTAWVGSADLTWQPREELVAILRAARYNDFSPDGGTALRSELFIDLKREVRGGFSLRAGSGISRLETFSGDEEHVADALVIVAGIGYSMTERLSVEVADRWTNQWADRDEYDYDRHLVSGVVNLTF